MSYTHFISLLTQLLRSLKQNSLAHYATKSQTVRLCNLVMGIHGDDFESLLAGFKDRIRGIELKHSPIPFTTRHPRNAVVTSERQLDGLGEGVEIEVVNVGTTVFVTNGLKTVQRTRTRGMQPEDTVLRLRVQDLSFLTIRVEGENPKADVRMFGSVR